MFIVMAGAIVLTTIGNLMVIISVSHFKQLHSPTNFLILSLAITDCLLGLVIMPYSMVRSLTSCWYFGDLFCRLHSCLDMTLSTTSIFHLFFISVDRYYAVCQPLHYCRNITTNVILVFICISWAFSCLYSSGLVFSNVHTEGIQNYLATFACTGSCSLAFNKIWAVITSALCFFMPGTMMIGIYIHIFSVASKQAKLVRNQQNVHTDKAKNKLSFRAESKAAKALSIVMGVFLFCWLPFFIVTLVDPYTDFSASEDVYNTVLWFGYLNSAINPIIYALFYPWFKRSCALIVNGNIFKAGSSFSHIISSV
ncbi:trace amine-associated receptor 4 [Xenopus tropicalis]|uniref:Trace amine-associated receptor 4 n=1 Tax=Xenopus tropicalis TaxID=8364 RepID=A0A8J0QNF6_XENTR|nr:trace amine-associated receptor 4 [Xenopus tropicalis]